MFLPKRRNNPYKVGCYYYSVLKRYRKKQMIQNKIQEKNVKGGMK